jgi:hypothetical protein
MAEQEGPTWRPLEGAQITTFGLQILADHAGLASLSDETAAILHLYIVCRRPRIAAIPSEWTFTTSTVSAVFTSQVGDEKRRFEVEGPNSFNDDETEVACEYPFTWIDLRSSTGEYAGGRVAHLLPYLSGHRPELDLEVLYVGQAYGQAGSRSARDRLLSHETLQGIYAEAISNAPDQEVWLVMLGLEEPYSMIQLGPTAPVPFIEPTEDEIGADLARLWTGLTEQQQVNLAEASLIKYFEPPYNEIYKRTFPSPAHKTYSECYDLDLNSVGFEIETQVLAAKLYSESRSSSWIHSEVFPLHDEADRKRMFDFSPPTT